MNAPITRREYSTLLWLYEELRGRMLEDPRGQGDVIDHVKMERALQTIKRLNPRKRGER